MKKVLLAVSTVCSVLLAQDEVSQTSGENSWRLDATLRAFWIDESTGAQKSTATALGGFLGGSTPEYYGFSAYASLYVSQEFWGLNPDNPDAIDGIPYDGKDGFAYFGEAEISYKYGTFEARAGRIKIDTPYADADDIRMMPNTFEGAYLRYGAGEPLAIQMLYLTRWAGFDSTEDSGDQSGFKKFAPGSNGMAGAGVSYALGDTELGAWYYYADALFQLGYLDAAGHYDFAKAWYVEWGVQGAWMSQEEESGIEGTVTGATATLGYGRVFVSGAYNYAAVSQGHFVTNGFGGGPYYTSLDESTIAGVSELIPGNDVSVWRASLGADVSWWPHDDEEGLHLEGYYGRFDLPGTDVAAKEADAVMWLGVGEHWRVDAIYSDIDIVHSPDPEVDDIQRVWARLDYTF